MCSPFFSFFFFEGGGLERSQLMAGGQWESRWMWLLLVRGVEGRWAGVISEGFLPLPDDTSLYQAVVGALRPTRCSWDWGDLACLEPDSVLRGRW